MFVDNIDVSYRGEEVLSNSTMRLLENIYLPKYPPSIHFCLPFNQFLNKVIGYQIRAVPRMTHLFDVLICSLTSSEFLLGLVIIKCSCVSWNCPTHRCYNATVANSPVMRDQIFFTAEVLYACRTPKDVAVSLYVVLLVDAQH